MSLMRKHQQKVKEKLASGEQPAPAEDTNTIATMTAGSIGKQQLAGLVNNAMAEDLKSLKGIKSIEGKKDCKSKVLIPKYEEYVERLRANGSDHEMIALFTIWLFDTGDLERGIEHGLYCVDHSVKLPERFARDMKTFLADAVLEFSEAQYEAERSPQPYFTQLFEFVHGQTEDAWDLPDPVRKKYYRLDALLKVRNGKDEEALKSFERANELGAKVKTAMKDCKKRLGL